MATVLVLLLCGACSEDPAPIRADPTPSSSPVTSTAAIGDPTEPASSTPSPREVVDAWVNSANAAYTTGDTATMRLLTTNCITCDNIAASIEGLFAAGGRVQTGDWTLSGGKTSGRPGHRVVIVGIRMPGGNTVPSAGAESTSFQAQDRLARFETLEVDGTVTISRLVFLS